jgi:hypothetical protein
MGDDGPSLLLLVLFFIGPVLVFVFGFRRGPLPARFSGDELAFQWAAGKRGLVWFVMAAFVMAMSSLFAGGA